MPIPKAYPVNLIILDRRCLVVGGGRVAERKIRGLLDAGADVTVVSPTVTRDIHALPVTVHERPYLRGEVAQYRLAIVCTDDAALNRQIFSEADAAGVWVNTADQPQHCSWTLPSVARQGDLTIAVATNGHSPAFARWLRRRFEEELDERYGRLLTTISEVRTETKVVHGSSEVAGWDDAIDHDLFDLVASGDLAGARRRLRAALGIPPAGVSASSELAKQAVA